MIPLSTREVEKWNPSAAQKRMFMYGRILLLCIQEIPEIQYNMVKYPARAKSIIFPSTPSPLSPAQLPGQFPVIQLQ